MAEIAATVQQIEACANTCDLLRFYALISDSWFGQLPKRDDVVAEITALETATPTPVPPGRRALVVGPWHVEILEDGRVAAAVVWFASEEDPCLAAERTKLLLFVNDGGRWLIDEIVDSPVYDVPAVVGEPPANMLDHSAPRCDDQRYFNPEGKTWS